jgi:DNA-binding NarL/FixJ family response regulator
LPLITEAAPQAKIIVLSQSDKEADVLQAITLGSAGYLLKSATDTQITEGIRIVINGGASLDNGIAKFILKALKETRSKAPPLTPALSKREMEVLTLMAEGHVQKEIADRLAISNYTVNSHINHIYEKLHVANAPAAVNKAHRFGLFQPNRE